MVRNVSFQWLIVGLVASCLAGPARADDVKGVWLREGGVARVKIANCGASMCGTVVWLKDPDGPAKVGQQVFFDLKPSDGNSWTGAAFNPEDGRTYNAKMVVSGHEMVTTGCAFGGLICKSLNWAR